MPKHLLVTNDFPPKVGGIQNYLFELWRRLDPESFVVYTTPYDGDAEFDQSNSFKTVRSKHRWLAPYPWLVKQIRQVAEENDISHVVYDPTWPLGLIAPSVGLPYGLLVHGAEAIIPAKLHLGFSRVVKSADFVIGSSAYALESVSRSIEGANTAAITPGVDLERFAKPHLSRTEYRNHIGVSEEETLIVGVSRLVKRKGFDTLIKAVSHLSNSGSDPVRLVIAGSGRDRGRLEKVAQSLQAPVGFLGRITDEDLVSLYGAADISAMLCHNRWFGLEQEGFGIVFSEAAAAGTPQVAGRSGGSHEAVVDNVTGIVVPEPTNTDQVVTALEKLVQDKALRDQYSRACLELAQTSSWDAKAEALGRILDDWNVGKSS